LTDNGRTQPVVLFNRDNSIKGSAANERIMVKTKSELLEITKLGIPAVVSQLSQMSLGVIDTMMAGRVNAEALAAIAIGTNIINPVIVFILGIFLALNPIVAHLNGRGEFEKIGALFQLSIKLALVLSIPAIIALTNSEWLMKLIGIEEQLITTVQGYLTACAFGIVPLFMFLALRFCNEGLFSTKAIMIVSIGAIPFNVVFNYWFIWGGLGVPAFGAVGVGYATSVVWLVMLTGIALYTLTTRRYQHLTITGIWHRTDFNQIKEIFKVGLPMGIGVGMEIAMFAVIGLMIGRYAVEVVAAHQIAINIASMAYMIPLGLSIALSARVGFFAGRSLYREYQRAAKVGVLLAMTLASLSALGMWLFAPSLVKLYTDDGTVLAIASGLLSLAAIFQWSDALQVSLSGALRGLKDTQIPMVISAIAYWLLGFPSGFYLAEIANLGVRGYWIGIIIGLSTAAIMLLVRWILLNRKYSQLSK
jgi:MATE family multidrug resistance protein